MRCKKVNKEMFNKRNKMFNKENIEETKKL